MLTETQLSTMLELQSSLNAVVNPAWITAGYPYLRAAVIEGAEAIEHHGWKWWKKQEMDLGQLQMELVDIWHFALSDALISHRGDVHAANAELMGQIKAGNTLDFDGTTYDVSSIDTVRKFELLIGLAAARRFSTALFNALLDDCKLSWGELYLQYVSKNVLNVFRQDKGYKQGTYKKEWNGREDNEHLVEILRDMDSTRADLRDALYGALSQRYALL
jgi:hypothetical protein